MKKDIKIDTQSKNESKELFSHLSIPWKVTRQEAWKKVARRMEEPKIIQMNTKSVAWWKLAVAAILVLSFGAGLFMRSYTVNIESGSTFLANNELPDGSMVFLNAHSKISYKPYWWWSKRDLHLEGEAFFEVQKGKRFRVFSDNGSTEVLGTTFNIFTRKAVYEVVCLTGKVKVEAAITGRSVILHPAQKAVLLKSGELSIQTDIKTEPTKAWMSNRLDFSAKAIGDVFNYVEMIYAVDIEWPDTLLRSFSGSFDKPATADEILQLICRPFNLKVEKLSANKYRIKE